jgi:hypothetical protein
MQSAVHFIVDLIGITLMINETECLPMCFIMKGTVHHWPIFTVFFNFLLLISQVL